MASYPTAAPFEFDSAPEEIGMPRPCVSSSFLSTDFYVEDPLDGPRRGLHLQSFSTPAWACRTPSPGTGLTIPRGLPLQSFGSPLQSHATRTPSPDGSTTVLSMDCYVTDPPDESVTTPRGLPLQSFSYQRRTQTPPRGRSNSPDFEYDWGVPDASTAGSGTPVPIGGAFDPSAGYMMGPSAGSPVPTAWMPVPLPPYWAVGQGPTWPVPGVPFQHMLGDASFVPNGAVGNQYVQPSAVPLPPPVPFQPATMEKFYPLDESGAIENLLCIRWSVDARKLASFDKHITSPPFELPLDGQVAQFRMFIRATHTSNHRHGESFRKSRGKGSIELSCLSDLEEARPAPLVYRLSISKPDPVDVPVPRGPVEHDFTDRVSGLPRSIAEWNFREVVEESSQTFVVLLEILPAFQ